MLTVDAAVLPATFAALRDCGGGERECVVYWLGPREQPDRVTEVLQPDHEATAHHYEVSSSWLTHFFLDLSRRGMSVRAQVHTHPGRHVEHSPTDDSFALAPSLGFVSLVLPDFAMGDVSLDGAYVASIGADGWTDAAPSDVIRWS